jgi:hypothetical protein
MHDVSQKYSPSSANNVHYLLLTLINYKAACLPYHFVLSATIKGVMFLPSDSNLSTSRFDKPTEDDARNCYKFTNKYTKADAVDNTLPFSHRPPFEDESVQLHYENFRITSVSRFILVIWIMCLVVSIQGLLVAFSYSNVWLMRTAMTLRVLISLLAFVNYYKIFYASRQDFHQYVSFVTNSSNFIIISSAVVNGMVYAWTSSLGSCLNVNANTTEIEKSDHYSVDCNPSYEMGGTPVNPMLILIVGNVLLVTILRCHSRWAARVSYVVMCLSVIAAAVLSPDFMNSFIVIFTALVTIAIYNDVEVNSLTMFKALLDLESTNRIKTIELKQFIGNVAHDLKVFILSVVLCYLLTIHSLIKLTFYCYDYRRLFTASTCASIIC